MSKSKKDKEKRILEKENQLLEIFRDIDENKRIFIDSQIKELAWYIVSCQILRKDIDEVGTTIEYCHGENQWGKKANPDIATLMSYQKNVNVIFKQLMELVPLKKDGTSTLEKLMSL